MSSYTAPLTDFRFALHDVLGAHALFARLGYTEASPNAEILTNVTDFARDELGYCAWRVING